MKVGSISLYLTSIAIMSSSQQGTIEQPPSISSLSNTKWTRPDYTLPLPALHFLFHLECDMETFRHIGEGPYGDRSTVIFKGGRFEGPRLRGEILPGGGGTLSSHPPFISADLVLLTSARLGDRPQPWRHTNSPPEHTLQSAHA